MQPTLSSLHRLHHHHPDVRETNLKGNDVLRAGSLYSLSHRTHEAEVLVAAAAASYTPVLWTKTSFCSPLSYSFAESLSALT